MRAWGDTDPEICFACQAEFEWGAKGSGRTLKLCPDCNAIAQDIEPNAGGSYFRMMIGLLAFSGTMTLPETTPLWAAYVWMAGAVVWCGREAVRLATLAERIRDPRNSLADRRLEG